MEPAGAGLARIMAELLRGTPPDDAPVFAWPVICGAAVAERTKPLLFAGGVLRVAVSDQGWRGQLAELESRYLREFSRLLGPDRVRRIEFIVAQPDKK
jgi:hypothetical protein